MSLKRFQKPLFRRNATRQGAFNVVARNDQYRALVSLLNNRSTFTTPQTYKQIQFIPIRAQMNECG